jgi:hypothetical protein
MPQAPVEGVAASGQAFQNEAQFKDELERYLTAGKQDFVREYRIPGTKSRVDFALRTWLGEVWALVECKWPLDRQRYQLKDAADHFEQCLNYVMASRVPVFLGPFITDGYSMSSNFTGGHQPRTLASFSAFAGRANVGLMFLQVRQDRDMTNSDNWDSLEFFMRQRRVAHSERNRHEWPDFPNEVQTVLHGGAASEKTRS